MGRTPDPKELQDAKGNPNKRSSAVSEDQIEPVKIAEIDSNAPLSVRQNEDAHAVWLHLTRHMGVLFKDSDRHALGRLCTMQARYVKCELVVQKEGETYDVSSKHGEYIRMRPELIIMLKIEPHLLKLEDRFGLSPSMRTGVMSRLYGKANVNNNDDPALPLPDDDFGFTKPSGSKATH